MNKQEKKTYVKIKPTQRRDIYGEKIHIEKNLVIKIKYIRKKKIEIMRNKIYNLKKRNNKQSKTQNIYKFK